MILLFITTVSFCSQINVKLNYEVPHRYLFYSFYSTKKHEQNSFPFILIKGCKAWLGEVLELNGYSMKYKATFEASSVTLAQRFLATLNAHYNFNDPYIFAILTFYH